MFLVLTLVSFVSKAEFPIFSNTNEKNSVTREELIDIYLGNKTRWENGEKVTVVLLNQDNFMQRRFIRNTLGISISGYIRIFKENKNNTFYTRFVDEDEIVETLKTIPGSIGMVGPYFLYYDNIDDILKKVEIK